MYMNFTYIYSITYISTIVIVNTMKNSALVEHFSLPKNLGTSNATSHSINYHHYTLHTTWLLQHIASVKDKLYSLFALNMGII